MGLAAEQKQEDYAERQRSPGSGPWKSYQTDRAQVGIFEKPMMLLLNVADSAGLGAPMGLDALPLHD